MSALQRADIFLGREPRTNPYWIRPPLAAPVPLQANSRISTSRILIMRQSMTIRINIVSPIDIRRDIH